jgi:fatty-acyl-CoA synthase
VVGLPHPEWAERPFALVVLKPGASASEDELRRHLLGQFAKWQLPNQIRFVDKIAKTSVGKLDKKVIRAEYSELYL